MFNPFLMAMSDPTLRVELSNISFSSAESGGATDSGIRITATGFIQERSDGSYTNSYQWVTGGDPTKAEVRYTVSSGTTPSGISPNSWYSLTTDRTFYVFSSGGGITSASGTLSIRDGDSLEVLDTCNYTISSET